MMKGVPTLPKHVLGHVLDARLLAPILSNVEITFSRLAIVSPFQNSPAPEVRTLASETIEGPGHAERRASVRPKRTSASPVRGGGDGS